MNEIQKILNGTDEKAKRSLFSFNYDDSDEAVLLKYNLWIRYFHVRYFKSEDADFHREMDLHNIEAYRGSIRQFIDVAFKGAAKTARMKLFLAFVIANDLDHHHRFMRCLSADLDNAKQSVTDIYNLLVAPKVRAMYPEIFERNEFKREERMDSLTTTTGVKLIAKQIGVAQRGKIQDDAKADFDWYDDIETRETIRSAVTTKKIAENMEEARTGLAQGGSSVYTLNYFSEMANVHVLVTKNMDDAKRISPYCERTDRKVVMIIPILLDGRITWDRYTMEEIEQMKEDDEDFEGERMCKPNASKDIYIPRDVLEAMPILEPVKEIADFKIFREYCPSHRYAGGQDVAGGVGLDSSTSVFIDFDTVPAQVVATYKSNTIDPESFGDEIYDEANRFGGCLIAPENNKFDSAVLKAKLRGAKIYKTRSGKDSKVGYAAPVSYGWNTNGLTKPKMLSAIRKAIIDGLIQLNDKDLIQEFKGYTRNDFLDDEDDPRMTTRHFDLLIACAIAWQMKDHVEAKRQDQSDPNAVWEQRPARPTVRPNPAR